MSEIKTDLTDSQPKYENIILHKQILLKKKECNLFRIWLPRNNQAAMWLIIYNHAYFGCLIE